jgi:hypothetical protein
MRFRALPNAADVLARVNPFTPTGEPRPELLRAPVRSYMGVDLGQAQDHAAIVIVQRLELALPDIDPVTRQREAATLITVRYAERIPLGMSYPAIARYVASLALQRPMSENYSKVIVDATGLGAPVVDLLREIAAIRPNIIPVVITSAEFPSEMNGRWHVPKRDLIDGVRIAFEGNRIAIADSIDAVANLTDELENMRLRRNTNTGHTGISGRKHDDLVLALSLAWWKASSEVGRLA